MKTINRHSPTYSRGTMIPLGKVGFFLSGKRMINMVKNFWIFIIFFALLLNLGSIKLSHASFTCMIDGEPYTAETAYWEDNFDFMVGPMGKINAVTFAEGHRIFNIGILGYFEVNTYTFPDYNYIQRAFYFDNSLGIECEAQSGTLTVTSEIGDRLKGTFEFTMTGWTETGEKLTVEITDGSFDLLNIMSPTTTSTAATTTIPSDPCAAESIYGDISKATKLLRYFRDIVLSQTKEGRALIRLYYLWSPFIVTAMEEDEAFKEEVKQMIDGVLPMIEDVME